MWSGSDFLDAAAPSPSVSIYVYRSVCVYLSCSLHGVWIKYSSGAVRLFVVLFVPLLKKRFPLPPTLLRTTPSWTMVKQQSLDNIRTRSQQFGCRCCCCCRRRLWSEQRHRWWWRRSDRDTKKVENRRRDAQTRRLCRIRTIAICRDLLSIDGEGPSQTRSDWDVIRSRR